MVIDRYDPFKEKDHNPPSSKILECFQEKWILVFRPETRQNNNLGSGFVSIKTGKTLALLLDLGKIDDHGPVAAGPDEK